MSCSYLQLKESILQEVRQELQESTQWLQKEMRVSYRLLLYYYTIVTLLQYTGMLRAIFTILQRTSKLQAIVTILHYIG